MVIGFNDYYSGMQSGMMNPLMGGMHSGMMSPFTFGSSHLNFKNSDDMRSFYDTRLDDSRANIYSNGQGRISQKAYMVATQLQGALAAGNQTEVGNILKSLQEDKHQIAGIELAYDQLVGSRCGLRNDIRHGLGGGKTLEGFHGFFHNIRTSVLKPFGYSPMSQREAIDIFNEGAAVNTTVAANALKEAMLGFGTDEKTVEDVLEMSRGRMTEVNASYQQMGSDLTTDIRNDYHAILDGFGTEERLTGMVVNELI